MTVHGTQLLADDWTVRSLPHGNPVPVHLPHDAMISEPRSANAASGAHGAFFPGGRYEYSKRVTVPADASRVSLVFEGVQGIATVSVDGTVAGSNASAYREFEVDISHLARPGAEHIVVVEVDNSMLPSARWYTGSGIYRPVWMRATGPVRFGVDGIDLRVGLTEDGCELEFVTTVETAVASDSPVDLSVRLELSDAGHLVGSASGPPGSMSIRVANPTAWTDTNPHLYSLTATVLADGQESERVEHKIGLRTVEVDPRRGLLINGHPTLLRGACIHHDNGILGAATFRDAEYRRARILKEQGYNSIRSAHNPLSRAFLDACDELGLYVLDELTDVWFTPKTPYDSASQFEETWPKDLNSMVAKDRLRPSVIMYSIGNEIAESATRAGVSTAQEISSSLRELDPSRPTTLATNFVLSMLAGSPYHAEDHLPGTSKPAGPTSTTVNALSNRIGRATRLVTRLPKADSVSRDAFATVDVAGYNYGWVRYRADARRYPDRVVLGSESFPGEIAEIWPLVEHFPNVIGDFAWTGWEYLGEVGLGTWTYGDDRYRQARAWPQIVGGGGAIDLLGNPSGLMLLARAVWRIDSTPGIAVRPVDHSGQKVNRMLWRGSDAVPSWAWLGCTGRRADVEVYSAADDVELIINGRSLGRRPAGPRHRHAAHFQLVYEPGELVAIARVRGVEIGRSVLRSAGKATLHVVPEIEVFDSDKQDLMFVRIELADANGTVEMADDDTVEVTVSGGSLIALGSAAPATTESYTDATHRTYQGRALAVVRPDPNGPGVGVDVTSKGHGGSSAHVPLRRAER